MAFVEQGKSTNHGGQEEENVNYASEVSRRMVLGHY